MAQNAVAANLLMLILVVGGMVVFFTRVKQEVFPEFSLDMVSISVPYPGASPAEVEQGIIRVIEEGVRGLDGVKQVTARALEGVGSVSVEILEGSDPDRILSDVKTAVDRIVNFPEDAEKPTVSLVLVRKQVIQLALYGDLDEESLRLLGERVREELLALPQVTQADLQGTRPRELSVEISQASLRSQGLSLGGVAGLIRRASVELPGGSLKTPSGQIMLRMTERRDYASEFEEIHLRSGAEGSRLLLAELGQIKDGYQDTDVSASYNGQPAVLVNVYRVGKQTPIEVAKAVKEYSVRLQKELPEGVSIAAFNDRSRIFGERVDLLKRNALMGLVLVFITLGLFLELRLAFWVMLGIPISFLGSFWFLPSFDVSVNMISLFAFIITLGVVVDDAIVVGENIFEKRSRGLPYLQAAVEGVREVGVPVIFAVLTTIVAFMPLLFVPGISGKLFRNIPTVVIAVISISLIESLFVLPAHLGHVQPQPSRGPLAMLNRGQQKISKGLEWFIQAIYGPILRKILRFRYTAFAFVLALMFLTVGLVKGGHLAFTFMPRLEGDIVKVSARLPLGAPVEETERIRDRLIKTGEEVLAQYGGEKISKGLYAQIGQEIGGFGPHSGGGGSGSHIVDLSLQLVSSDQREVSGAEIARAWREANQDLVGVETSSFSAALRMGGGMPVEVQLQHREMEVLEKAAGQLAAAIREFKGTSEVDDGFTAGKVQMDLKLRPVALNLGLSEADVARQIRDAFFGAEALRQQRGRDELRVMVRLPLADRQRQISFEQLMLRSPAGGEIPLNEAVDIQPGRAYSEISRIDGLQVVHVTADVDPSVNKADKILDQLKDKVMPGLLAAYPGLSYSFEGQRKDRKETFASLGVGFLLALLAIYSLLAIPFRSYLQPIIIMTAIPFGIIGAVAGHLISGYDLSVMSLMGVVALSGIVVNDSLILVLAINQRRREGASLFEAIVYGGQRRFRPILLTSLTTFFGLMPMIFESSVQARFLIPMALSLGWGVLFATFVILLLIPSLYLILEDLKGIWSD